MPSTFEVAAAVVGMGMWIFFPIGLFLSVAHLDSGTDQKQQTARREKKQENPAKQEDKRAA